MATVLFSSKSSVLCNAGITACARGRIDQLRVKADDAIVDGSGECHEGEVRQHISSGRRVHTRKRNRAGGDGDPQRVDQVQRVAQTASIEEHQLPPDIQHELQHVQRDAHNGHDSRRVDGRLVHQKRCVAHAQVQHGPDWAEQRARRRVPRLAQVLIPTENRLARSSASPHTQDLRQKHQHEQRRARRQRLRCRHRAVRR
mmetsp:Transcript_14728/g.39453  ORF Transcript_14728/g.39453 Transcript_14728/m.39453 type:complete len:200 (-) Transcript_14728:383-982(-)